MFFDINITINIFFMNCITFFGIITCTHELWLTVMSGLQTHSSYLKEFLLSLTFPCEINFYGLLKHKKMMDRHEWKESEERQSNGLVNDRMKRKLIESLSPFTQHALCSLTAVLLSFSVNIVQMWGLIQSDYKTMTRFTFTWKPEKPHVATVVTEHGQSSNFVLFTSEAIHMWPWIPTS